jgi:hypothetical protein
MIVSHLISGLGNQMFQFAVAYSLAKSKGTDWALDTSWYYQEIEKMSPRAFELGEFGFDIRIATAEEIDYYTRFGEHNLIEKIERKLRSYLPYYKQKFYKELHFHYDPNFWKAPSDCYLYGFWQSDKYFGPYQKDIRQFFKGTKPFSDQNKRTIEKITDNKVNAVAIHIRRGDMVHNPEVRKIHGFCTSEYYHEAAKYVMDRVENCRFFVFSDEPEWCRENFKPGAECIIVDQNTGMEGYNDIRLMAMCKHNIIPNSSFSWWGAWLNENPNKIVVAPKKWFAIEGKDTKDLLHANWIRL